MKLFTSSRYAAVASTAALVVALGGTSYAASQIGGNDIRNGSVGKADLAQVRPGLGQADPQRQRDDDGREHQDRPQRQREEGGYLLSSKVNVYANSGGYTECWLTAPNGNTLDYAYYYAPSSGYGEVVNTSVVAPSHTGTIQLELPGQQRQHRRQEA